MNKKLQIYNKLKKSILKPTFLGLSLMAITAHSYGASVYTPNVNNIIVTNELTQQLVSLNLKNKSAEEIITAIAKQAGVEYAINEDDLKELKNLSINVSNVSAKVALDTLFKGTSFSYKFENGMISVYKGTPKTPTVQKQKQQLQKYTGKIVDSKNEPVIGVVVSIKGSTLGTISSADGIFNLTAKIGGELEISHVGYKTTVYKLTPKTSGIIIKLESDVVEVEDVVVTGIFNRAKESYTGAASIIKKEEMEAFRGRNLLQTISNIDPAFRIRENNAFGSDPNALPEIEVRGVTNLSPVDFEQGKIDTKQGLSTPLIIMDGFEITLQRMMDLEEEDVEMITLLKDASATAIYGSRGANGVVIITLKTPQIGKLKISYRGSFNIEVPNLNSYNMLNAAEKLQLEKDAGFFKGNGANEQYLLNQAYQIRINDVLRGVDTYWLSQPLRTGLGQQHNITLGGGDKNFRYSMSGSFNNNAGVMKKSNRQNGNAVLNLSYLYKKWRFNNSSSFGINKATDSPYGNFGQYVRLNPYSSGIDNNGNPKKMVDNMNYSTYRRNVPNPMYNAESGMYSTNDYITLTNNTRIEVEPIAGLKLSGAFSVTLNRNNKDTFLPPSHTSFDGFTGENYFKKGSYDFMTGKSLSYGATFTANYNKTIGKHVFSMGFHADMNESSTESYSISAVGYTHDHFDFFGSGMYYKDGEKGKPDGSEATSRRIGLTGNINYIYDNKYYFDVSYRSDGSSVFGKDTRFAPFYSFGGGWHIAREKWIESLNVFNNLRLRVSYGISGVTNFPEYQSYTSYMYNTSEIFGSWMGASILALGNPELKWSDTRQWNVGLEMGFFKGTLIFDFNAYDKRTYNLISPIELPESIGFDSYYSNKGSIKNMGFELSSSIRVLRKKSLSLSIKASISSNKTTILTLSKEMKDYMNRLQDRENSSMLGNLDPSMIYEEGSSQRTLWAVKSLGIDPSNGKEILVKKNGELTYDWKTSDKVDCGVSDDPYRGSINIMFRYKHLGANVGIQYHFGGQEYNSTLVQKVENADLKYNVDRRVYEDRWRKPGDKVFFKGIDNTENTRVSSRFVQNDNVLEASSINIYYDLKSKWLRRSLGIENLRMTASTMNIFRFSTIKMERGTSYPFSQRIQFSLNISF